MNQNQLPAFDRLPRVKERLGYNPKSSTSTIYKKIQEGLLPPPLKLYGDRASVWPSHEITAVIAATMAGRSKEEIRALVRCLVEKRQELYESLPHLSTAA